MFSYYCFKSVLVEPEHDVIFLTDMRDVKVVQNPCKYVKEHFDKLFVQHEPSIMPENPWMLKRFEDVPNAINIFFLLCFQLGSKYLEWYKSQTIDPSLDQRIYNCGLIGGVKNMVVKLINEMIDIMESRETKSQKEVRLSFEFEM